MMARVVVTGYGEDVPFANRSDAERALEVALAAEKAQAAQTIAVCDHADGKYFLWQRGGGIFRPHIVEVDEVTA